MRYTKYTKEQLENLSLNRLRNIDIQTKDEELHVQQLIVRRLENAPIVGKPLVFKHSVTDKIRTKEQEFALQKEMDEHNEKIKQGVLGEVAVEPKVEEMEKVVPEMVTIAEVKTEIVTEAIVEKPKRKYTRRIPA